MDNPVIVANIDPTAHRPFVERIRTLEDELAKQAEAHALITADLEAQRDAAIQRAEIAERKVREYEHAEAQVEGE